MNYIREITAFNQWAGNNGLSPSERVLWYALMDIANRSHWKPVFNASISELIRLTGLSKNTVYAARNKLIEREILCVTSRSGGQSALFSLTSIDGLVYQNEDERVPKEGQEESAACTKMKTPSYQNEDDRQEVSYQNEDANPASIYQNEDAPKNAYTKMKTPSYQNREDT